MQILPLPKWIVACTIAALLLCSGVWGYRSRQQSKNASVLVTPSPTWLFSSATLATPGSALTADPRAEALTDGGRNSHSHTDSSETSTPTPNPELVKRGQHRFYEVGCSQCHGVKAEGAVGPEIARTDLPLDAVISQVYEPPGEEMPPFSPRAVSEEDIAAIYAYLQSLPSTGARPKITTDRPDSAIGEALYRYFGCFGCHGYQAEGAFGPRLAGTALSFEELRAQVREPRERMPAFRPERISDEELAHIYAFLQSLAK